MSRACDDEVGGVEKADACIAGPQLTAEERLRQEPRVEQQERVAAFLHRRRNVPKVWVTKMAEANLYWKLTRGMGKWEVDEALMEGMREAAWKHNGDLSEEITYAFNCCTNFVMRARDRKAAERDWRQGLKKLARGRRDVLQRPGSPLKCSVSFEEENVVGVRDERPDAQAAGLLRGSPLLVSLGLGDLDQEFLSLVYEDAWKLNAAAAATGTSGGNSAASKRHSRLSQRAGGVIRACLRAMVTTAPEAEWRRHRTFRMLEDLFGRERVLEGVFDGDESAAAAVTHSHVAVLGGAGAATGGSALPAIVNTPDDAPTPPADRRPMNGCWYAREGFVSGRLDGPAVLPPELARLLPMKATCVQESNGPNRSSGLSVWQFESDAVAVEALAEALAAVVVGSLATVEGLNEKPGMYYQCAFCRCWMSRTVTYCDSPACGAKYAKNWSNREVRASTRSGMPGTLGHGTGGGRRVAVPPARY